MTAFEVVISPYGSKKKYLHEFITNYNSFAWDKTSAILESISGVNKLAWLEEKDGE